PRSTIIRKPTAITHLCRTPITPLCSTSIEPHWRLLRAHLLSEPPSATNALSADLGWSDCIKAILRGGSEIEDEPRIAGLLRRALTQDCPHRSLCCGKRALRHVQVSSRGIFCRTWSSARTTRGLANRPRRAASGRGLCSLL